MFTELVLIVVALVVCIAFLGLAVSRAFGRAPDTRVRAVLGASWRRTHAWVARYLMLHV